MYSGQSLSLNLLDNGLVELVLNQQGQSVNTLNQLALNELTEVVALLQSSAELKGMLITSAKPSFVVGADISEFREHFARSEAQLKGWIMETHQLFSALEELPFPTVTAVNGMALGGGFELALTTDFRVAADDSRVGLPEVNLGICPGWGGTVRLSRLIGAQAALKWIVSGKPQRMDAALKLGAVDRVVAPDTLREAALELLVEAVDGKVSYLDRREYKRQPYAASVENRSALADLVDQLMKKQDANYPAGGNMIDMVSGHLNMPFQQALEQEADCLAKLARSDAATSLIGLFLNDQLLKKKARH